MPWSQRLKKLGSKGTFRDHVKHVFGSEGPRREYIGNLKYNKSEKLPDDIKLVLQQWKDKISRSEDKVKQKEPGHGLLKRTLSEQKTMVEIFEELISIDALENRLPHIYEITAVMVHKFGLDHPSITKMLNFLYNNKRNSFHGLKEGQLPLGKLYDGNAGNLALAFARDIPIKIFDRLKTKVDGGYPILSTVEIINHLNEIGVSTNDKQTHDTLQFLEYLGLVKRQPRKLVKGEKNPSVCWALNTKEQQPIDYPNTTLSVLQRMVNIIRTTGEKDIIEIPAVELYKEMLIEDRKGVVRIAGSEKGEYTKNTVIKSILPKLQDRDLLDLKKIRDGKTVRWVIRLNREQRKKIVQWINEFHSQNKVPSEELLSVLHIF